jgi:iron complex outermembrane receptor protein
LNARVVFVHSSGKWEAAAFGSNLTDERYTTGGFFSPLLLVDDGTIGRPREYGVSLKLNFK